MIITIATVAKAAAGAVTVILSSASLSNVYDTYSLATQYRQQFDSPLSVSEGSVPVPLPVQAVSTSKTWKTVDEGLTGLTNMSRRELKELFVHCEPPDVASDLLFTDDGWRYEGTLLDNGPILTPVTNFITNKLFGRGQQWLGKAYSTPSTTSDGATIGIGKNRFTLLKHNDDGEQYTNTMKAINTKTELLDRTFDYSIEQSAFPSRVSSKSLFNRYSPHCSTFNPMSLIWRGMVDELRVIQLENDGGNKKSTDKKLLLLGMGYFTWSLGGWNSAPFCLVARKCED